MRRASRCATAPGVPVRRSGPCRLLQAVAEYLDGRRFPAFAALVRHPAIEARLTEAGRELRGDWLTELDDYHARHLPHRVAGRPGSQGKTPAHQTSEVSKTSEVFRNYPMRRLHEAVEGLLGGLGGERRAIAGWGIPLAELLAEVYGKRPLNPGAEPDRTILDACDAVHGVLRGHQAIPEP